MEEHAIPTSDAPGVLARAMAGAPLSAEEAAWLAEEAPFHELALAAQAVEARHNPERLATFIVDAYIPLVPGCDPGCPYCTPALSARAETGPALRPGEVAARAAEAVAAGAGQVVLQGTHRADLDLAYYAGVLAAVKSAHPDLAVVGFSPSEVLALSARTRQPVAAVLAELRSAGLDVLLGGGAEANLGRGPEHRRMVSGEWAGWREVLEECAALGLPAIAVFPFGLGESPRQRAAYLQQLDALQAWSVDTWGRPLLAAIIPFAPPEGADAAVGGGQAEAATGHEYLRMVALARLLCPHIPAVQASFLTQGAKVAQVALDVGASDFGGTQLQFRHAELAAGRIGPMSPEELVRLAKDAGRVPARRDARYAVVARY